MSEKDKDGKVLIEKTGSLGSGTYGKVYSGTMDGKKFAIKRNFIDQTCSFIGSVKEFNILTQLSDHPHIVKLIQMFDHSPMGNLSPNKTPNVKDDTMYFVFEYADSDGKYLTNRNTGVSFAQKKFVMAQLLLGLEFMHTCGLIHRDIKPENVLCFSEGKDIKVKLADFGMSKYHTYQDPCTPGVVSAFFRAPEILSEISYDYISDIWSLGCLFFEIICNKFYIATKESAESVIFRQILLRQQDYYEYKEVVDFFKPNFKVPKGCFGRVRPNLKNQHEFTDIQWEQFNVSPGTSEQYLDLLRGMLQLYPTRRFTAAKCLDHPFFDAHRKYITTVRETYRRSENIYPRISSTDPRRVACMNVIKRIHDNRMKYSWYRHRILFHSIDLIDRYLSLTTTEFSEGELGLLTMSVVYIFIKFFICMVIMPGFLELDGIRGDGGLENKTVISKLESFEKDIVISLNGDIYRETMYELSDRNRRKLTEDEIYDLLYILTNIPNLNTVSYSDILSRYGSGEFKSQIR